MKLLSCLYLGFLIRKSPLFQSKPPCYVPISTHFITHEQCYDGANLGFLSLAMCEYPVSDNHHDLMLADKLALALVTYI